MTKATMPEPVAWMTKDGRAATKETKDSAMATPSKLAFSVALITTDQAEAYAAAKVREALEQAARVAMNAPITAEMLDSDDAKAVCFHASTRILMLLDKSTPARPESE